MNKIKYVISLCLLVCLLFSARINVLGNENNQVKDAETKNALALAESFVTEYFQAIELNYPTDSLLSFCNDRCRDYVNNKIQAKQLKYITYGTDDICNYRMKTSLIDTVYGREYISFSINVIAHYNYKESDLESDYSEVYNVVYSKGERLISDFYSSYDYYDIEVRGERYIALYEMTEQEISKIEDAHCAYVKRVKKYYEELNEEIKDPSAGNNIGYAKTVSAFNALNKSAMVSWAVSNYNQTLPSSGNTAYVPNYIDFPVIPYAYDCTNFVSHAILAGGTVVYDTGGSGVSSTGWYCRSINNRASSWSGVSELYSFLTTNSTKGPVGYRKTYTTFYAPYGNFPYEPGDLMQFHSGSTWRHSAIITGYLGIGGGGVLEAAVTDRTDSSTNHHNRRESDIYPGNDRRVIIMTGYYN